ncbi:hypothetical protein SmJEL517_g01631 [Synchytrium microbalum]|uniref:AAA+ ATPase domain-containing protein n=1 Tax=Synchytrium microbalum TaxID=1806994 RepID=A0A507CFN8_9FUNG|nr:uncharacterized protein SmJEL517_g01631 [Synchytrium microbalum]TPX36323.1 hypothetical protein SmJEL517_g01631 [Synchytrium microbalum]
MTVKKSITMEQSTADDLKKALTTTTEVDLDSTIKILDKAATSEAAKKLVNPLVLYSLAHKKARNSLTYRAVLAVSRRLNAVKDALVQSVEPNGSLEPLIQLLNVSSMHGILLAYLPESPLGHKLRTNIYAVDMFVTSLLVTGTTSLMSVSGSVLRSLFSPTQSQTDSVSVKVEYYRMDAYGEQMVNLHYKALSWLISRASQNQTGGDFRMVPFEEDGYNYDATEEDDAGPPFNILPRGDGVLNVENDGFKFSVYFDHSGDSGEGKKDDNRGWSSSRAVTSEPPIIIQRVDSGPTDISWMHAWLVGVTKSYLKEETKNKVRARWEMRETYWARIHSLHSNRGLASVALDQPQEELLKRDLDTFLADRDFYARIGLPYRRGYLFSGKPGTGKTSLINALSATFDRDLYYINLKDVKDDNALQSCFSTVPKNSIIVFEDIDAQSPIVHTRDKRAGFLRQAKQEKRLAALTSKNTAADSDSDNNNDRAFSDDSDSESGIGNLGMFGPPKAPGFGGKLAELLSSISLSTLLNCLDGYAMHEGTIIIMTSNHPEVLDPALIRPGRIDTHLELGYCTHYQLQHMYQSVLDDEEAKLSDITAIPPRVIPPCEALRIMVLWRSDPEKIAPKLKERAYQLLNGAEADVPDAGLEVPVEIVIPKKLKKAANEDDSTETEAVDAAVDGSINDKEGAVDGVSEAKSVDEDESSEETAKDSSSDTSVPEKMSDSGVLLDKQQQQLGVQVV